MSSAFGNANSAIVSSIAGLLKVFVQYRSTTDIGEIFDNYKVIQPSFSNV